MVYNKNKMKLNRLFFILPILLFPLVACDAFEKEGDINDYVGHYVLDGATERTYHVYWGNEKLISESTIMQSCSFTIYENKKVLFVDHDGKEYNGTVKVLEKYCRFYKTPLDSTYKFNLRYDKALYYSWESTHVTVEYDVTYRSIIFVRK